MLTHFIGWFTGAILIWFWNSICRSVKQALKKKDFRVEFNFNGLVRVGETASLTVWILAKSKDPEEIQELIQNITIEIRKGDIVSTAIKEAIFPESESSNAGVRFKFSVRVSGDYWIKLFYKQRHIDRSPMKIEFLPALIEPSKTSFLRASPLITCIQDYPEDFEIQPKDRYDNNCRISDVELMDFELECQIADDSVIQDEKVDYGFCATISDKVRMQLTFSRCGVYRSQILHGGKGIHNGEFSVVVISRGEKTNLLNILHSGNPNWHSFEGRLLAQGPVVQKDIKKVFIYVCPSILYVRDYMLKIFPIRVANFRLSTMTKIDMTLLNSEDKTYTFTISDKVQPKVTIEMKDSVARVVMAMFSYYLGRRIGGSENFDSKQRVFNKHLREANMDLRFTTKQVKITRFDIIESTYKVTKGFRGKDWYKNFRIDFRGEPGIDGGGLRREWLNILCTKFFDNTPNGLFSSLGNSRLVHPTPIHLRSRIWKPYHYELAGSIVGKCMFETACGDSYKQMVNGRFSRSFLAQIIGLQPNYRHFEQDDPELYLRKVKYILEKDVEEMELTFSEEEYSEDGQILRTVDLIPNGSKIQVTNSTKEDYLNLLAKYRLGTRVHKEIEAFLKGLHEVVPDDLLCNFDEGELELLMCGRSDFEVDDLRKNYSSSSWTWDSNSRKILDWFWAAVNNMTDEEKARLLQFTTGSALLPHGGFKALDPKFSIEFSGRLGSLPTAQTCVNRICLSDHYSFELFEKNLKMAVQEGSEGFGFA